MQLYRLERYSECRSVYTDLIRNSQDEYEEERKTNLTAVVASVSQWENTPVVSMTRLYALYLHFFIILRILMGFILGFYRKFLVYLSQPMSCVTMLPVL